MAKNKRWTYDSKTGLFACAYPGCTYTHTDPGGITLHSLRSHEGIGGKSKKKQDQPQECSHTYQLLSRTDPRMVAAMDAGYCSYCTKCLDLK